MGNVSPIVTIGGIRYHKSMLGPVVNAVTVVVLSIVGTFLVRGIPDRIEEIIRKAIGLSIIFIGIKGAFDNENILLLIVSMVFGAIIGEIIDIDKWMNKLGSWAESKLVKNDGNVETKHNFSKAFVSATILFCTGSMAIVGSMQSGLVGNHQILFTKSVMDGSMSLVFGATLGIGAAFSAIPLFLYQGGIALAAFQIRDILNPDIIREMAAVGSLIISAIGFNFLGVKEIKVANLIPAMFIPWIYLAVVQHFSQG